MRVIVRIVINIVDRVGEHKLSYSRAATKLFIGTLTFARATLIAVYILELISQHHRALGVGGVGEG